MVQVQRQLFTVDEYYKMAETGVLKPSDRVELIRGEIFKMSPIRSPHSGMVNFLVEKLILELHEKATIASQNPIRLDNYSEPEPDIVVAHYRKDRYRRRHPLPHEIFLLIEVADSTLAYDREIKAPLYAGSGIHEYWILNIPEQQIEIFKEPVSGVYLQKEIIRHGQTAFCERIGFSLSVEQIF